MPELEPVGVARHVAVGGGEAVGVADADVIAVAALAPDALDGAVGAGEDRGAGGRRPVDAGMRAGDAEQRMHARAEARGVAAALDRIAHQELLRAVALLVIVVDDAVRGAEAPEVAGVAVDGHRGVEQLAHAAIGAVAVAGVVSVGVVIVGWHVEEHVEACRRASPSA